MPTISPRGIILNQTTVFRSKKADLTVSNVSKRYKRDHDTKKVTNELDGYNIDVIAPKSGEVQTVKLPLDVADTVKQVQSALDSDMLVKVSFNGTFKGKYYSLLNDGRIKQGITATATELSVITIEAYDDDLDDEVDL
ncbi:hypothetical protein ACTQ1L_05635 [Agathobacter sp. LCP21S3_B2]|uniref:hypothetical protein n=1 Tax=Agathobacter sp. LCP21S3_B2 TaxID=3438734 RepID=UPI003F8E3CCB